jgi:hypothetical protein
MRLGTTPALEPERRLRLVVDNGQVNRRPKDFRLYVTRGEICNILRPRRRWNPWKLVGNLAMIVFASLSMSVLVWAGVVWLTGW